MTDLSGDPTYHWEDFHNAGGDTTAQQFKRTKIDMQIIVNLMKEKETAGTFRYRGSKEFGLEKFMIYLSKKDVLELGDPETIVLTISALQAEVVTVEE